MHRLEHLITVETLRKKGRPIGKVDNAQLEAYIEEVEQMYIRPSLGDKLFLTLLFGNYDEDDTRYKTLLEGGLYHDDSVEEEPDVELDENENNRYFAGLHTAMSYFVYAQNIMTGDFQSTRYGMVMKDNDYSTHLSSKDRSDAYNNALEVGNTYLKECILYCKRVGLVDTDRHARGSGSVRIVKIG